MLSFLSKFVLSLQAVIRRVANVAVDAAVSKLCRLPPMAQPGPSGAALRFVFHSYTMATGSGARNVLYKALQRPAVPHTPARRLATRPHPLANRPSPSGPVPMGRTPSNMKPRQQRWSTLTAILLATLTGTSTYVVGRRSAAPPSLDDPTTGYVEPTRAKFDDAMTELKSWIPDDCLAEDRDSLVAHGHSDWAAHDPKGLPGAVLYPRDTADVVKIVKLASKYGIPLVPYCAGTSLEGELSLTFAHVWCPAGLTTGSFSSKVTLARWAMCRTRTIK